jgi:hypothetical protein
LFGQRFVQFLTEFQDLYARFGYVFDPEFEPLLISACSFRRPIQREDALRVHGNPVAKAAIRSTLIAEAQLKRSAAARTFMSLLNFEPDLLQQVLSKGQADGGLDDWALNSDTIALGFQHVASYMRVLIDISRALHGEQAEVISGRCESRLRQLTRWRVNRYRGIDGPFKSTALFVNDRYLNGAYSKSRVSDEIDELLDNWGFTHTKVATA